METGSVIHSVAETGGEAVQLTALDASGQETSHLFPQFLPDGQRFLFQVGPAEGENAGLYMASLEDPGQRQKLIGGFGRRPFVDNHILFGRDGNLYAQVFDPDSPRLAGEPIAIASQIPVWGYVADVGWFGASPGGTLAYISSAGQTGQMQLSWRDRSGQQLETLGEPGFFGQIALSPDGRNVALEIGDEGEFDLWVMEVARGVMSRVTVNPGEERDPVWSPDGRSLAYVWRTLDGAALLRKGLRVSDPETVLMDSPDEDVPESWSLNGETIMVVRRTAEDEQSVWALSVSEGGDARPVLNTGFRIDEPQISPNGQWLAYVSQESGNEEVYLESFDEEGERLRVSLKGGGQPKWRADSQELFFVTLEGVLMAVDVGTRDGRLEVSLPTRLFQIASIEGMGYDDYAVNDDGTRFLVKVPIGGDVERKLQIISNWTGLLETR
jgi:dipeptidyl aminopeptidase/acylaminoacyl peptidase